MGRNFGIYTLLRAVVFAIVFGLMWLGLHTVWSTWAILLLAVVVSAILSIFVLRRQRDALAGSLADRSDRRQSMPPEQHLD